MRKLKQRLRPDRRQMQRLTRRFGFVEQPGSGCGRWRKSDLFDEVHQVEGKATDKPSIRITKGQLVKISREADAVGKVPALVFGIGKTPPGIAEDWIAVPAPFYEMVLETWKQQRT